MIRAHALDFPPHPFDYVYLTDALKQYRFPRNKIRQLIAHQDIIRVKKGLYVARSSFQHPLHKKTLANLIYGPSYVSLDSALSYWGLIPERVEEVTSVTSKRNKLFATPFGIFSYRYLPMVKFNLAVERIESNQTAFLIATKEKALCDKLYFAPPLVTQEELLDYLANDLRVDMGELKTFRRTMLKELQQRFLHQNVSLLSNWCLSQQSRRRI